MEYQCTYCNPPVDLNHNRQMRTHLYTVHLGNTIACELCPRKKLTNVEGLEGHMVHGHNIILQLPSIDEMRAMIDDLNKVRTFDGTNKLEKNSKIVYATSKNISTYDITH